MQEQLGELMRTGFMRLSSARYAMGADRVSLLQLPATMTATTRLRQGAFRRLRIVCLQCTHISMLTHLCDMMQEMVK